MLGGAVHPGDQHPGVLALGESLDPAGGQKIERTAEARLQHRYAQGLQLTPARSVGAQGAGLGHPARFEGLDEGDEIGFRPAVLGRPQQLNRLHGREPSGSTTHSQPA